MMQKCKFLNLPLSTQTLHENVLYAYLHLTVLLIVMYVQYQILSDFYWRNILLWCFYLRWLGTCYNSVTAVDHSRNDMWAFFFFLKSWLKKSFFSINQPFISIYVSAYTMSEWAHQHFADFWTSCWDSREHSGTFSQLGTQFYNYLRQHKRTES